MRVLMCILVVLLLVQSLWGGVSLSSFEGVRYRSLAWVPAVELSGRAALYSMLRDSMFAGGSKAAIKQPSDSDERKLAGAVEGPAAAPSPSHGTAPPLRPFQTLPPPPPSLLQLFPASQPPEPPPPANASAATPAFGAVVDGSWAGAIGFAGRIPRVMHQTWKGGGPLEGRAAEWVHSWVELNPDWQLRHYDDDACAAFVRAEFPEFARVYDGMTVKVHKADFFRYLIVLKYGGFYADLDTECKRPLSSYLGGGGAALVVGVENEFESLDGALARQYARQRQLVQWAFAAEPGHPGLRVLAEEVARIATEGSAAPVREANTLEQTGPGVFTDVISQFVPPHAPPALQRSHPAAVLPRVAWGANPAGFDGILPDDPGVLLLHQFASSWRPPVLCRPQFWRPRPARTSPRLSPHDAAPASVRHPAVAPRGAAAPLPGSVSGYVTGRAAAAMPRRYIPRLSGISFSRSFWTWTKPEHFARCAVQLRRPPALSPPERALLYEPAAVTVPASPPFTILVHHRGFDLGRTPDGRDESYEISSHGVSQSGGLPGSAAVDVPSVHDAFLNFLAPPTAPRRTAANSSHAPASTAELFAPAAAGPVVVMVDAGAGLGLTTLAAATRGVAALALEGDPSSASLLAGSLAALQRAGALAAPAAAVRRSPGEGRGLRCVDHHLSLTTYVAADRTLNGGARRPDAPGPLNVVAGRGAFGGLAWYRELVAGADTWRRSRCCPDYQLPVALTAVDDEAGDLLRAGAVVGGVRFGATNLGHALLGAERLLSGRLPGVAEERPGPPKAPNSRNLSATHANGTAARDEARAGSPPCGGAGAEAGADAEALQECLLARRLREIRGAAGGAGGRAPPPWVVQLDLNRAAVSHSALFAHSTASLVQRLMGLGYSLRVFHWGPACQQRVLQLQRARRLPDGAPEAAARWCLAVDAEAVAAAVRRIPSRRTEHFIFVHRDLAALSGGPLGRAAVQWMAALEEVSVR